MYVVELFSVLVFLSLCLCVIETRRVKRVVGGEEVVCGTQPRVVSLRNARTNQHLCGAMLLSTKFALTAAHCVLQSAEQYVLYANNYCNDIPRIEVSEVIVNDIYDKYSRTHDIALLRINHEFDDTAWLKNTVLPKSSFGLSGQCTMFGYGYKYPDVKETSDVLLAGRMSIVSLDECVKRLGYAGPSPDDGMMCAMGAGVDACQGDSGGPLICQGFVEAVSSYGLDCGMPGFPSVFTSVGAHLKWLNKIMNDTR